MRGEPRGGAGMWDWRAWQYKEDDDRDNDCDDKNNNVKSTEVNI